MQHCSTTYFGDDTTRAGYLEQFRRKAITFGGISWMPRIGKELFISDRRVNGGFLPARQAVLVDETNRLTGFKLK